MSPYTYTTGMPNPLSYQGILLNLWYGHYHRIHIHNERSCNAAATIPTQISFTPNIVPQVHYVLCANQSQPWYGFYTSYVKPVRVFPIIVPQIHYGFDANQAQPCYGFGANQTKLHYCFCSSYSGIYRNPPLIDFNN